MVKPRYLGDGSVTLIRPDREKEKYFDSFMIRDTRYTRRWIPCPLAPAIDIATLADKHVGKTAVICGCGGGLDSWLDTQSREDDDVVISINRSVTVIDDCDYYLQFDPVSTNICTDPETTIVLPHSLQNFYVDMPKRVIFIPERVLKTGRRMFTVLYAMELARHMGIRKVKMVGFDLAFDASVKPKYAECLGGGPLAGPMERYTKQKFHIQQILRVHSIDHKMKYLKQGKYGWVDV